MRVGEIQLEAILAGVARPADDDLLHTGHRAHREVVIRDRVEIDRRVPREHGRRQRSLQGQQRGASADILHRAVEGQHARLDVRPVLRNVRGVDHQHQVILEPVDETIILDGATLVAERAVVRLPDGELRDVVRGHVIHEIDRAGPRDEELAHVTDVEQPAALAHRVMFGGDAGRILNRHLEPGKRHDAGAKRYMDIVQRRALECF